MPDLTLPEPGDVGAWVDLPTGQTGQVWALDKGTRVWVADGRSYVLAETKTLVVVAGTLQLDPADEEPGLFAFEETADA